MRNTAQGLVSPSRSSVALPQLPTISIVTCSFRQARFLDATMRSVLNQNYPGLEYLLVDGGSQDGSVDIIRRHADRLAYWVSEPDKGQTDALIKGFDRASGEVQGWLCSDDLLLPSALHTVGRFFADHPHIDFIYGDALWIDAAGRYLRAKKEMSWSRFVYLFDHNYLPQPSCFWRRSLYQQVGGLDRSWNLAMDSDLWLRFAQHSKPHHLSQYLSCMRFYPEQKTRALKPAGRKEDDALRKREAPWLAAWPSRLTHPLARATRAALKLSSGGYGATMPQPMVAWLMQHATPE